MLAACGRALGPRPATLGGAAAAAGLARWFSTKQGGSTLQARICHAAACAA